MKPYSLMQVVVHGYKRTPRGRAFPTFFLRTTPSNQTLPTTINELFTIAMSTYSFISF